MYACRKVKAVTLIIVSIQNASLNAAQTPHICKYKDTTYICIHIPHPVI